MPTTLTPPAPAEVLSTDVISSQHPLIGPRGVRAPLITATSTYNVCSDPEGSTCEGTQS